MLFVYGHSIRISGSRLDGIAITNHRVLRGADDLKGEVSLCWSLSSKYVST